MHCLSVRCAGIAAVLSAIAVSQVASAQAPGGPRTAYNPVTGQPELDTRYHPRPSAGRRAAASQRPARPVAAEPESEVAPASYDSYGVEPIFDGACDCGECASGVACGDVAYGGPVLPRGRWTTGFEAVFVKPRFEENMALGVTESDGESSAVSRSTQFDYDLEFSPRVFIGWRRDCDFGLRATWWQFDHTAGTATASPPENGFGEIEHPEFGDVELSTSDPEDVFSATTDMNAYTIDLEAVKTTDFCSWQFSVGGGLRHAYIEQGYLAHLSNDGELRGQIDFRHSIEGFGPTISMEAFRPIGYRSGIFCKARGSVLFGDAKGRLVAGEDLDLSTQFDTTITTDNDDVLSIGEVQLGYRWRAAQVACRPYQPFCSIAMEGQVWNGAGNAAQQDGMLGFFGFNTAVGIDW